MKNLYILLIVISSFTNSYGQQCSSAYCYIGPQYYEAIVDVINYPKRLDGNSDLIFDLKISMPSCVPTYSGNVIIVKVGGAGGPNRNLDTISATINSGTSTILPHLIYPGIYLNEGVSNGDSTMYAFEVIFMDVCSGYPDASPPIINILRTNCSTASTISVSGITLTSNSTSNNKWYLNDTLITGAINQTYKVTRDGKYKLKVLSGLCNNFDSVNFQGITYNGAGLLTAPVVSGASYSWYLNGNVISGATSNTFLATVNGIYDVVIICSTCRLATNVTIRFRKEVTDLVAGLSNTSYILGFNVYPNPFENILYIEGLTPEKRFFIYNSIGQSVSNGKSSDRLIDLTNLPKGIYLLVVMDENLSINTTQLIKQ